MRLRIEKNLAVWGCEESCNSVIIQSLSWSRRICIFILTPIIVFNNMGGMDGFAVENLLLQLHDMY